MRDVTNTPVYRQLMGNTLSTAPEDASLKLNREKKESGVKVTGFRVGMSLGRRQVKYRRLSPDDKLLENKKI